MQYPWLCISIFIFNKIYIVYSSTESPNGDSFQHEIVHDEDFTVRIRNSNLTKLHAGLLCKESKACLGNDRVTSFLSSGNDLTTLHDDFLPLLVNLLNLELVESSILNLTEDAFSGLGKLKILNLSRNLIEQIPKGTFLDLMDLQVLDLSHNSLVYFGFNHLTGCRQLRNLHLGYNQLEVLEGDVRPLQQLEHLDIRNNIKLRSVEFEGMKYYIEIGKKLVLTGNVGLTFTCSSSWLFNRENSDHTHVEVDPKIAEWYIVNGQQMNRREESGSVTTFKVNKACIFRIENHTELCKNYTEHISTIKYMCENNDLKPIFSAKKQEKGDSIKKLNITQVCNIYLVLGLAVVAIALLIYRPGKKEEPKNNVKETASYQENSPKEY